MTAMAEGDRDDGTVLAVEWALRVFVDKAVSNGFFCVDQPAGHCEVSTSTEVERKLTFILEPDQVRYVRLNVSMGFFARHGYRLLVDEPKGTSEIASTGYTGPPLAQT